MKNTGVLQLYMMYGHMYPLRLAGIHVQLWDNPCPTMLRRSRFDGMLRLRWKQGARCWPGHGGAIFDSGVQRLCAGRHTAAPAG